MRKGHARAATARAGVLVAAAVIGLVVESHLGQHLLEVRDLLGAGEPVAAAAAQSLLARLGRGRPDPTALFKKRWLVAGLMLAIRCGLFPVLILGNLLGRGDCLIVKARRT